ncbi:bifunctional hydroxymethylpyrimidine kinase/phosphomethylpyrimidine kinase [Halomonas sp. 25-S5]|uniref:bifunctional hydroxymethylpyrimidine kinase/phosphomethylpyrimidine kinase n=1 Tax=Halomonas sp. 25-S5 TaxID=2994065 RepID=UPI0024683437|nr:bifunctional hydroxymethylpyrimidine kinase/phosphomethylpyrimidine kinase [Halomonas sp. 25-S5]
MIANVLSIAGTDPTGGAGIQADLKTFSALGAYGMSAITAAVAQNTQGVRSFVALEPNFIADQIDAVFDDVRVDAVKIGMVANAGIAVAIADRLSGRAQCPIVLDPVMVAKSGDRLLAPDAVTVLRDTLIPLCTLITPNLPEAGDLLQQSEPKSTQEMRLALEPLQALGADWVLLKGGHLDGQNSIDLLHGKGRTCVLEAPRIVTRNTHGTGCTLSAAITALLPLMDVPTAVRETKDYLTAALAAADSLEVGDGHGPVHHFHAIWN